MAWCVCWLQDLAAAIDEEDVAKFTDAVKEFDSMTPLVSVFSFIRTWFLSPYLLLYIYSSFEHPSLF